MCINRDTQLQLTNVKNISSLKSTEATLTVCMFLLRV